MSRTACEIQESGVVELYFYDELDAPARAALHEHLPGCTECRHALEELAVIRDALAARPDVSAPPEGNWVGFMERLDAAIAREGAASDRVASGFGRTTDVRADSSQTRVRLRPSSTRAALAMAALLTLVTMSVAYVAWTRTAVRPGGQSAASVPAVQPVSEAPDAPDANDAFAALSEQHFERSKLVVLGLVNKEAQSDADWEYERRLASTLLNDTRLYRLAAQERGMAPIARVMGDLELVLLQTSMSEAPEPGTLQQIQSLIRKRDLVTKMNVVTMAGKM